MTKVDLEKAIQAVLGDEVYRALVSSEVSLPFRLNHAVSHAFVHEVGTQEQRAVLREAAKNLEEHGHFMFDNDSKVSP